MNENEVGAKLPQYQSHKIVGALRIKEILRGGVGDPNAESDGSAYLAVEEPGFGPIHVSREYMQKHQPHVGGYFVVYPDGYESFSPKEAFESGYTRV